MRAKLSIVLFAAASSILIGCATAPKTPDRNAGFANATMNVDGRTRQYMVYVPAEYTPKKHWPVILFLHGAGETGDDGRHQAQVGLGPAIRNDRDRFPCIVVMPQCPKDRSWRTDSNEAMQALNDVMKTYSVDKKRIYLTGLSMGGFGTWALGAQHPDLFAALIPICGGGIDPQTGAAPGATALAKIPIWAFHGAKDPVVPVEMTRKTVEAVKKAGGNIQYTEYPELKHNAWDATYGDAKVIAWLLKQAKH